LAITATVVQWDIAWGRRKSGDISGLVIWFSAKIAFLNERQPWETAKEQGGVDLV
jgi:hypothetical protein